MGKTYEIFPGFTVKPGEMSLRVCTADFLDRKGFDYRSYGAGFGDEQAQRYGGKKLKLHHVRKLKGGPDGAKWHFYFSENSDTFTWNEYMFEEFWSAGGKVQLGVKTTAPAVPRETKEPEYSKLIADDSDYDNESYDDLPLIEDKREPARVEDKREPARVENREDACRPVRCGCSTARKGKKSNSAKLIKLMFIMSMMNQPPVQKAAPKKSTTKADSASDKS